MIAFHKILLVLATTLLLCSEISGTESKPEEGGLDFNTPIQAVNAEKRKTENINYDTFCETKVDIVDDQLLGCQLKTPNTGFELRVCKLKNGCGELVDSSLDFHDSIMEAKLSIVRYSKTKITNLKCRDEIETPDNTCVGYVEEWVASDQAKLVQFNQKVFGKQEDNMISDIRNYQATATARTKTVEDLQKIVTWMTPPDGQCTKYKQLCDLEGFFKKTGGFLVHNPNPNYKMMLGDYCHSGEGDPTNERVLAVLKKFIKEFTPAQSSG